MKGNSKGFTLTEVLVSVAVAGILVVAVATFFIRYYRLENHFDAKENILTEIENIYELFSGSPEGFQDSFNGYFGTQIDFSGGGTPLYYDGSFEEIRLQESGNYLLLEYTVASAEGGTLYRLKITPHYRGEAVRFTDNPLFVREILVGGEL